MEASTKRTFHYHADASPLGGHITHPFEKVVHTQASTSLAQAGGHAESRIDSYQLDNTVTVMSGPAYSHTTGVLNKTTGAWTTLVTSVVENLNVLEVVTADRIVSKLHVEYPQEGDHPRISIIGSKFVNLCVNGESINPVLDIDLLKSESKGEFPDKHLMEEKVFNNKVSSHYKKITETKGAPEWLAGRHASMKSPESRKKKGYVLCSLVDRAAGSKAGNVLWSRAARAWLRQYLLWRTRCRSQFLPVDHDADRDGMPRRRQYKRRHRPSPNGVTIP